MSLDTIARKTTELAQKAAELIQNLGELQQDVAIAQHTAETSAYAGHSSFIMGLTVFVLAVFVGYYVVWRVTPALHSPLMSVTNAISSVIIVGALLATGLQGFGFAQMMGFLAVILASINIFGGFTVTQRMLQMFSRKS